MGERKAVTKAIATRYARSGRAAKKTILDELAHCFVGNAGPADMASPGCRDRPVQTGRRPAVSLSQDGAGYRALPHRGLRMAGGWFLRTSWDRASKARHPPAGGLYWPRSERSRSRRSWAARRSANRWVSSTARFWLGER